MSGFKVLALAAVAGLVFTSTPPKVQAQVAVEVGVAPDCPYGYYDYAPIAVFPTATMGPNGLMAACLLA